MLPARACQPPGTRKVPAQSAHSWRAVWLPQQAPPPGAHLAAATGVPGSAASLLPLSAPAVLHKAAGNGRRDMVKLLLKYKADIHAAGVARWTPLHTAADAGAVAVAELLLDAGAHAHCCLVALFLHCTKSEMSS